MDAKLCIVGLPYICKLEKLCLTVAAYFHTHRPLMSLTGYEIPVSS